MTFVQQNNLWGFQSVINSFTHSFIAALSLWTISAALKPTWAEHCRHMQSWRALHSWTDSWCTTILSVHIHECIVLPSQTATARSALCCCNESLQITVRFLTSLRTSDLYRSPQSCRESQKPSLLIRCACAPKPSLPTVCIHSMLYIASLQSEHFARSYPTVDTCKANSLSHCRAHPLLLLTHVFVVNNCMCVYVNVCTCLELLNKAHTALG